MIIWVSTNAKELLGYLSVEDFCAMTNYSLRPDGPEIHDAVELHRTARYIFGALRTSQYRPTLRWSLVRQELEHIPVERLKN
jgi:hypothetical protein